MVVSNSVKMLEKNNPFRKKQHVQRSRKKMLASQRASTFQRKENTGKEEKTEMKGREELKKQKHEW